MKDTVLFEHILATLLDCHDPALDERDQRENILVRVVQLKYELGDRQWAEADGAAAKRIPLLEKIKQEARNLLGAGDDGTWKRVKQRLIEAIEADETQLYRENY